MYPNEIVEPMREELTSHGVLELRKVEDVNKVFNDEKKFLLVVNSVCGCAGASMRPAIAELLDEGIDIPIFSVFAGVDIEACDAARNKINNFPPSSPSIFLIKNGKAIFGFQREDIKGHNYFDVKDNLSTNLKEHL